jgi:2-dehydro-3-deoxy-D-arabinonate dehydratase
MRLVQFYLPGSGCRIGILDGDEVLDITSPELCSTMDLIERATSEGIAVEEVASELDTNGKYSYEALNILPDNSKPYLLIPINPPEVWGCGVTYKRSAEMRDEDTTGAKGIYDHVYFAERPEIFFKATAARCVGPNDSISIRSDSTLTAAEPELAYVLGKDQGIIGFTVCNDVSAWDIERENPLYLPQSKIFHGCCALGPVLALKSGIMDPYDLNIICKIIRDDKVIFAGEINSSAMKRTFEELTDFLCRDNPIPMGTVMTTGTGIMIPNDYALAAGDVVEIEIEDIGKLSNPVRKL